MSLKPLLGGLLAALIAALAGLAVTVQANLPVPSGWAALPGTSVVEKDGEHVLKMDQKGTPAGTALEGLVAGSVHPDMKFSFKFKLEGADASCGGGAPRIFVAGGALYAQLMTCPTADAGEWQTVDLTTEGSWWSGSTNYANFAAAVQAHLGTQLGSVGLVFDNCTPLPCTKEVVAYFKDIVINGQKLDLGEPAKPTVVPTKEPTPDDDSGNSGTTGSGTTMVVITPPNTGDGGIR